MNPDKRNEISSQLFKFVKTVEDLNDIYDILHSIRTGIEKKERFQFAVGNIVQTENKTIMRGEIIEIIGDKAKVKWEEKGKMRTWILPTKQLRLKKEK